jgi:hypothetical protein
MTKRKRRYHHRKDLHRRLRHASHILSCGIQNLIRITQPVPKYPEGTAHYRFPAMVGHIDSHRDVLPPAAFRIGIDMATLPKHLFEDHPPVLVYAVDRGNGISQISLSQMLQTLDYWAQNKKL